MRRDHLIVSKPRTARLLPRVDAAATTKTGIPVISVARGGGVDATALVSALRKSGIAGAVHDAFENEPLPPVAGVAHKSNEQRFQAFERGREEPV
jgi:phosphoglycerate dehydrogenase-like enzyme